MNLLTFYLITYLKIETTNHLKFKSLRKYFREVEKLVNIMFSVEI